MMELFSSGEFPSVVLREGVRHARFRLMSDVDRGEAKAMAIYQAESILSYYQGVGLPSK